MLLIGRDGSQDVRLRAKLVGRGDDVADVLLDQKPGELDGLFEIDGAVVDAGEDVTVDVNELG